MLRKALHSKLHMARVTGASPDYMGSITIDADLLERCGMRVNDAVLVANGRNGKRFETYIFRGAPGSGVIEVNGAAALLVERGDPVIILHFALMTDEEYSANRPRVLVLDEDNSVKEELRYDPWPA